MNADLAFCLDQFADDQLKLVDGILEKIQAEETLEFQKVKQEEESPATIEQHRINKIRKGTHKEDQTIVNKFIQDLHESSIIREQPRNNDNDVVRDTLQAEIKTKLGACSSYVSRLGKLAKRKSNSTEFQQRCHEAVDLLRDPREFEEKFDELCALLEQSDICNCAQNVEQWWKEAFGNTIADINHRNKRFHPTIIEKNFANLSSRSRIVQRATTMIEKRKSLKTNQLDKYDVICNFVQQIQLIDENNCQETKADDLINKLNDNDNQLAIDYAKTWLKQRDEIRNQKEENICMLKLIYCKILFIDFTCFLVEKRYEMIKAEFNRQRIAQESKKLALAVLLSRLAIGSDHSEHFNQNLNTKVVQQTSQTLPVVTGDIKDPNGNYLSLTYYRKLFLLLCNVVQELSIAIKLVDVNTDEWLTNQNGIQDQFIIALCMAFLIPTNKMRVDGFTSTNSTLQIFALPPYGKNVIESLNGTSVDSSARIEAVRKCCSSMHVKVESISLGDCGLNIENKLMDPQWNRKYTFSNEDADGGQYWETPLDRGGKPYFCPSGEKMSLLIH